MIKTIAEEIRQKGGRAFYTGGYVRSHLINNNYKYNTDTDIEVFHLDQETLAALLAKYGQVKTAGKIYPVFMVKGHPEFDFSVARSDKYDEAAYRRDFTINALMMDILTGEILDFCGGENDVKQRVIRHITSQVFIDDPLRAYRAASLAARLGYKIHPETQKLMTKTEFNLVPVERIYRELEKMLMLSHQPSIGLRYLQEAGLLKKLHPRLHLLVGCPQEPAHHPEGDVWEHTLLVVDQASRLKSRAQNPLALMWAALLHDIGKPAATEKRSNKITAYGHDVIGASQAADFLKELKSGTALTNTVTILIREHMRPVLLYKQRDKITDKAIRKLAHRVDLEELLLLSEADYLGRNVRRDYADIRRWFLDKAAELGLEPGQRIKPLVQGRDLQELGIAPGKHYKTILDNAFELQLEGKSKDDILQIIQTVGNGVTVRDL